MVDLSKLTTEKRNPETMNLDEMSALEIVRTMNKEDLNVVKGVQEVLPQIAKAIEWSAESIAKHARIIYIGAGTSGRLGLLDAVECPPTFGVSYNTVVGLIAGGENAFIKAVEGAEDHENFGRNDLEKINCQKEDIVIGIAASGRTPYVIGALDYAKSLGCRTVAIA
jgi:Predicted sugar phosphate isomerase